MRQTISTITLVFISALMFSQQDSTLVYKKRVLESTEVDFLTSYYTQEGNNASVTGGIGDEHLTDVTPTIVVSLPLNADDVLTIDTGISAYTSASSSNLDPFDRTGTSAATNDDDENPANSVIGSPWVASSGASAQDIWANIGVDYSHSSDDRNNIWNANASFSTEYDYTSIGFGGGVTKLLNSKNTELGIQAKVYLDTWSPRYPTELDTYLEVGGDLYSGFFRNADILDQNGNSIKAVDYIGDTWHPSYFGTINDKSRNSYSISLSVSQILSKKAQISLFMDIVKQQGWLANPMQRVYFKDVANYYIGNADHIPFYTTQNNTEVFQLADNIERLPDNRFKLPVGMRFNYYINEIFVLRSYYRYYFDDWGVNSHTAQLEIPIKIYQKFTLYPTYRYYNQSTADYFAPFETHLSTNEFYTSDFDLSKFNANQYGFGVSYNDVFAKFHIFNFGLKSIDLKFSQYKRNTGLKSSIISGGIKFVMD